MFPGADVFTKTVILLCYTIVLSTAVAGTQMVRVTTRCVSCLSRSGAELPREAVVMMQDPEAMSLSLVSLLLTPSVEGQGEWLSLSPLVMSKVLKMC